MWSELIYTAQTEGPASLGKERTSKVDDAGVVVRNADSSELTRATFMLKIRMLISVDTIF